MLRLGEISWINRWPSRSPSLNSRHPSTIRHHSNNNYLIDRSHSNPSNSKLFARSHHSYSKPSDPSPPLDKYSNSK